MDLQEVQIPAEQLRELSKKFQTARSTRLKSYRQKQSKLTYSKQRAWLRRHGKIHCIGFDQSMRNQLRKYFNQLDEDGQGTLGLSQLVQPMIALGLAQSKAQVKVLFDSVDSDKSGQIQFDQFLTILRCGQKDSPIISLMQQLTNGTLVQNAETLPFNLVISSYRRKMLMDAIMSEDKEIRARGDTILKAYSRFKQIS